MAPDMQMLYLDVRENSPKVEKNDGGKDKAENTDKEKEKTREKEQQNADRDRYSKHDKDKDRKSQTEREGVALVLNWHPMFG